MVELEKLEWNNVKIWSIMSSKGYILNSYNTSFYGLLQIVVVN